MQFTDLQSTAFKIFYEFPKAKKKKKKKILAYRKVNRMQKRE
jgi:hypothetical protein